MTENKHASWTHHFQTTAERFWVYCASSYCGHRCLRFSRSDAKGG